ncbi:MAG TPA: NAD-dependent epimerase/dehydratase family protein [Gemmatimonadaceae bacterium]|nr:NAD-dependent epimerase/dehydratase family protein [Gemmatimonadaceae bacterium]
MTATAVLVVGGAGFVGSNLVVELLRRSASEVVIVDNLMSSERVNVPEDPRVTFVEGSIADDEVLERLDDRFDVAFHLATYHGNQSSIANPLEDHDNNLITTLKLYEHAKSWTKLQKLVYAASGCTLAEHTYGEASATQEDGPVPLDLDSPYQISKVVGEFYSVYYERMTGLPTVRARFQNVYGPREILGAGRWRGTPATVWRNVAPTFIYRALKGLPLHLDNGGIASRDFIYVGDIVEGLIACAERGEPGAVYNLASGAETQIRELAESILRISGSDSQLTVAPAREWDRSGHRFGSTEKAEREIGFRAQVNLEDGLMQTIEWTRQNLELVDRCVEQHRLDLQAVA